MLQLSQIQRAGGHFIPESISRGFRQFRILRGEILLGEKMYKASFISFPGVKYLLEVGETKDERDSFFRAMHLKSAKPRTTKRLRGRAYLWNLLTALISVFLIALSLKVFIETRNIVTLIGVATGVIVYYLCRWLRNR